MNGGMSAIGTKRTFLRAQCLLLGLKRTCTEYRKCLLMTQSGRMWRRLYCTTTVPDSSVMRSAMSSFLIRKQPDNSASPTNPRMRFKPRQNPVERTAEIHRAVAERIVRIAALHVPRHIPLPRDHLRGAVQFGNSFFAVILCAPFHWKPIRPTPMQRSAEPPP